MLELDESSEGTARYTALDKWNTQQNNLQKLVVNKKLKMVDTVIETPYRSDRRIRY